MFSSHRLEGASRNRIKWQHSHRPELWSFLLVFGFAPAVSSYIVANARLCCPILLFQIPTLRLAELQRVQRCTHTFQQEHSRTRLCWYPIAKETQVSICSVTKAKLHYFLKLPETQEQPPGLVKWWQVRNSLVSFTDLYVSLAASIQLQVQPLVLFSCLAGIPYTDLEITLTKF